MTLMQINCQFVTPQNQSSQPKGVNFCLWAKLMSLKVRLIRYEFELQPKPKLRLPEGSGQALLIWYLGDINCPTCLTLTVKHQINIFYYIYWKLSFGMVFFFFCSSIKRGNNRMLLGLFSNKSVFSQKVWVYETRVLWDNELFTP